MKMIILLASCGALAGCGLSGPGYQASLPAGMSYAAYQCSLASKEDCRQTQWSRWPDMKDSPETTAPPGL